MAGLAGVAYAKTGVEPGLSRAGQAGGPIAENSGPMGARSPAYALDLTNTKQADKIGKIECQTCKERTYQDGSNDPGVSFKAPGHIAPESSGAVVMAHEQEHVSNEQANARTEGRRVVSQSVRVFTSVCPECGRSYVSGGETRTSTAEDPKTQKNESQKGDRVDLRA